MKCLTCDKEMVALKKWDLRKYNTVDMEVDTRVSVILSAFRKVGRLLKHRDGDTVQLHFSVCPVCGEVRMFVPKDEVKFVLRVENDESYEDV